MPRIGFHTVRHDPLTRLDDEQLARALADGRAELAEVAGHPVNTIAYPHGRFDSRVVAAARESDFAIGLTCERASGDSPLGPSRTGPVRAAVRKA